MSGKKKITMKVTRFRPEQEEAPTEQAYEFEFPDDWVVLDALNHIKDQMDGTLSFRWSCRMGICGSCGMMVNGEPKLTCAAFLKDYYPAEIRVEPTPWIVREEEKSLEEGEYLQTPQQLAEYKQFSMCINCMLCYSACPVYGLEPDFIGPAAIALAHRYNLDSRDEGQEARQQVIASSKGIWECTLVGECSEVCPKRVDPAMAIQRTKVATTTEWAKSLILPGRKK
jgi:fumarate reductase iron-sulfur subunit